MNQEDLQSIYLKKIEEAHSRLIACCSFIQEYEESGVIFAFEAATLQLRKALEAVAFAAIAPNKKEYVSLRSASDKNPDYRKDFNARKIIEQLEKVNPDFFPIPIEAPQEVTAGHWHFETRVDSSLTKDKFSSLYDRLGKYLHSDNPWGNNKFYQNLAKEIPVAIESIRCLLIRHYIAIRTPEFVGVWVVEAPGNGEVARVLRALAMGPFVIKSASPSKHSTKIRRRSHR